MSTAVPIEKSETTIASPRVQFKDANSNRRPPASTAIPYADNPFNWELLWARMLYWLWVIVTKLIVTVIYLEIVSQGIVHLFQEMGKKFWKIPGFAILNDYEATHRITIAHVFAVIPLLATWMLWAQLLRMYLAPERFEQSVKRYKIDNARRVFLIVGAIVIVADAGLFAASFSMGSWGGSTFSATAVLATALYFAILAFVSLISMFLGDNVTDLATKKEEKKDVSIP